MRGRGSGRHIEIEEEEREEEKETDTEEEMEEEDGEGLLCRWLRLLFIQESSAPLTGSQLTAIPTREDPAPSSGLQGHHQHIPTQKHRHTQSANSDSPISETQQCSWDHVGAHKRLTFSSE